MDKKRSLGGLSGNVAPFLVAIIPLHEQVDAKSALEMLKTCDPDAICNVSASGTTYITYGFFHICNIQKSLFAFQLKIFLLLSTEYRVLSNDLLLFCHQSALGTNWQR